MGLSGIAAGFLHAAVRILLVSVPNSLLGGSENHSPELAAFRKPLGPTPWQLTSTHG
jgi:hypothetical protein